MYGAEPADFLAIDRSSAERSIAPRSSFLPSLEGCREPQQRAERCLELSMSYAGVTQGFLYRAGPVGAELIASSGEREPPPQIERLTRKLMFNCPTSDEIATRVTRPADERDAREGFPTAWVAAGVTYVPVLLYLREAEASALAGLAVLVADDPQRFKYPAELVSEVGRLLAESGDLPDGARSLRP